MQLDKSWLSISTLFHEQKQIASYIMLLYICFLALALLVHSLSEACGTRPPGARSVRSIIGRDAQPNSWPWMVSLRYHGNHKCGGTLIKPNWVLTASHCVYKDLNPGAYAVVVGAHRRTGTTRYQQTMKVKKVIKHWEYNAYPGRLWNDIALILLEQKVTLSPQVHLVCLPSPYNRVRPGTKCISTGWGRTLGGRVTDNLQQIEIPIVSHQTCAARNNAIVPVNEQMMVCAGSPGKGVCKGDGGGPLVCLEGGRWTLRGITSWTHPRCFTSYYSVFTRVQSYIGWMNVQMAKAGCRDNNSSCAGYHKSLCKINYYVKRDCKKTCGLC